eukprot:1421696-Pleurochrysis_carterae.AAC.1
MGLTPAQEGTLPVNLNHGDSLGVSRSGSIGETSVDNLRWYHQCDAGSFDVASLALMSRATMRHCRSHALFCLGTCGDIVVVVEIDNVTLTAVDVWHAHVVDVVADDVSAATGTDICAFECTASLFAWRQFSHAKLRAIVAHAFGASRVHCGNVHARAPPSLLFRSSTRGCLACLTIAGDAVTTAFSAGTTSTPTFSRGTTCPSGRSRVDVPVFTSTLSPTCASMASRPRLMRLCDALLSTRTVLSLIATMSPLFVRSGRSTSHLYSGVVVPFALTMTVVLVRRLPFTASEASVIQCMPAPVSPSHMAFAPIAAIVGNACMADA